MSHDDHRQNASDTPVGMFSNCHQGIVTQLEALASLPARAEAAIETRRMASALLAFFDDVLENHHTDEEQDLFPAVLRVAEAGSEADQANALVRQLTEEHRNLEKQWLALRSPLKQIAKGAAVPLDAAAVGRLVAGYQAHAKLEEDQFLPLAMHVLQRESNEMAALGLSLHIRHLKNLPGYV
ncbi:hemerythrin domain-containing protein [Denitromonas iodatirespirans]|uniref:Hemerythrin domain-containing protein n=1 Tax=Denitromonas iodatirespirans TaxID=2795389 RepID=A0A944DEH5_DENI1|nr:hemerythrin domain-containing protein [Denitromonas iodatirespirans]MBT0962968.1 hemerythrin domain-containing protein [Denitromonas iodatirespirans]